jgi:hypothetical protein
MTFVFWLLLGSGLAVLVVLALGYRWHRVASRQTITQAEPRSMVHVIESEEELRAAIDRATQFERDVADAARARAAHYEEAIPRAPVADLPSRSMRTTDGDEHARTA